MKYSAFLCLLFLFQTAHFVSFSQNQEQKEPPPYTGCGKEWVDSVFATLSPRERIAQLIFIAAFSNHNVSDEVAITDLIREHKIGGLIFFQGDALKQAELTNFYQSQSRIPLLIVMDGEWGLGMRLTDVLDFPYQMSLGAIQDDSLIYEMGSAIAAQCKRLGVHVNLAPVVDINNNPENPVINFRSFGENKYNVTRKAEMYMKGLQDNGILAVAKHFPGHGDTNKDSHVVLPVLNHSRERLDSLELYPYKRLIDEGLGGIMIAHLNIPALAIEEIESSIESGLITRQEVDERCKKVLELKYWAGLNNYVKIATDGLIRDLNPVSSELLNRKLTTGSITLLRNARNLIPLKDLENTRIATLALGSSELTPFQLMLDNYSRMNHYCWQDQTDSLSTENMLQELNTYDLVITGVTNLDQNSTNQYGVSEGMKEMIKRITTMHQTIAVVFGNAYILNHLDGIEQSDGLILTYQDNQLSQELAAQLIFGGVGASGRLPVSINHSFQAGDGLSTNGGIRFQYAIPEAAGMNSAMLTQGIDSIARQGILEKAYPGCQVLVARKGLVVFHKTYGYHTYQNLVPVRKDDLYDFASVTKITGPLPVLMKLYDEGYYSLDDKFSRLWPDFASGNKSDLVIRDVLAHQARLMAWIPYWRNTVKKNGDFRWNTFKRDSTARYNVEVAENLFLNKNYRNKIHREIGKSPLRDSSDYLYSGLSFFLYPEIIGNLTGIEYETYLKKNFYHPLGAYSLTYNPYREYPINRIIPTEYDDFFRMRQIHGWVHDEGAAMLGGVSGNAGLFGTINDLAKLAQMYLQMGTYGGMRYIDEETMKEFTSCQFPENNNRRGLGFDKPNIDNPELPPEKQYPAAAASPESFGHSGFTGTFVWVDPVQDLLYIFFSNRVYPTRENQKLYDLNIRTSIQQVIYDAIIDTAINNRYP